MEDSNEDQHSDNSFLGHLQRLEATKQEAQAEYQKLSSVREKLLEQLELAKEQRDLAGREAMLSSSLSASIQSKMFENNVKRLALERRLSTALQEETLIREEITRHGDGERLSEIRQNLQLTISRLTESAQQFEQEELLLSGDQIGPTRFEIDRAQSMITLMKQELDQAKRSLTIALENEGKLLRRLEEERHKMTGEGTKF